MTVVQLNKDETQFLHEELFQERSYLKHGIVLEKGACVFDVGANIGLFSLFVARECEAARIYAFEPLAPIYWCSRATLSCMDCKRSCLSAAWPSVRAAIRSPTTHTCHSFLVVSRNWWRSEKWSKHSLRRPEEWARSRTGRGNA